MDIYRENLIDHYNHPRNFGKMSKNDASSKIENISCGDLITMQIKVEKGFIKEIKFLGEGCAVAIASASILTEEMLGKNLEYVKSFSFKDLQKLLGVELSPSRIKCANLSLESLKTAVKTLTEKGN